MGGRGGSSRVVRSAALSSVTGAVAKRDWWKDTIKYTKNPETLRKSVYFVDYLKNEISKEAFNRGLEITTKELNTASAKMLNSLISKPKAETKAKKSKAETKDEYAKRYFKENYKKNREQRDITSLTYERAQKRLQGDVNNWFGRGMNKKK